MDSIRRVINDFFQKNHFDAIWRWANGPHKISIFAYGNSNTPRQAKLVVGNFKMFFKKYSLEHVGIGNNKFCMLNVSRNHFGVVWKF